jgi:hypothetical protein
VLHRVSSLRGNGAAVFLITIAARVLASSRIIELWFEAWWSSSRCLLDLFLFFRWRSSRYWKIIYPGWLAMKDRDKTQGSPVWSLSLGLRRQKAAVSPKTRPITTVLGAHTGFTGGRLRWQQYSGREGLRCGGRTRVSLVSPGEVFLGFLSNERWQNDTLNEW